MYLAIVKALRNALLAATNLNLGVDGQWFLELAPANAAFPYGVIAHNAGGMINTYKSEQADVRMTVKIVGTEQTATHQLAEFVRQALHEQPLTAAEPFGIWRCQQVGIISFLEPAGEVVYWHAGGIYRVRMSGE